MALRSGTRLGPYEVLAQIGVGGMGEVYRATDTKLKRQVALKILPTSLAADPDRLARFQREAEVLASLNHPNIAAIYGLEDTDGVKALVIELVEGPTLADRIAQGAIPIDEALPIVKQIAEALEAAHEQGIVHRDLKPANIKVRPDGMVKVLDFGLAKAMEPPTAMSANNSMSPTITTPAMMTGMGMILGTAAYMSPEQARGRAVDKRADIWAFGCVLFELLAGERAFGGEDLADTIGAVIHKVPAWNTLPAATPVTVRTILQRCLEKDPKQRIRDIGDVRLALNGAFESPTTSSTTAPQPAPAPRMRIIVAVSLALLVGAAVAGITTWALTRRAAEPLRPMRFAIVPPPAQRVRQTNSAHAVALSPDGSHVVYFAGAANGPAQLMVRVVNELDAVPLRGIAGVSPFFSPDGRWVGFFTGTELKKVSISGGPSITICRCVIGANRGASWGPDDTIVFATNDRSTGLLRVPAGGGDPRMLTTPESAQEEQDHVLPWVLPGGRAVLFTVMPNGPVDNAQVAVLNLATGQRKTLIRGGYNAQYVDTGHLVYAVAGTLRAVRFELARLEVLGDPVPVVEQVSTFATGTAEFDVSHDGSLVYIPGGALSRFQAPRSLVWVDRQGHETPIDVPFRAYAYPRISPDGARVALDIRDQDSDIWILDLVRRGLTRLTFDPAPDYYPLWTPDGQRIAFQSTRDARGNMYWQSANGTGAVEQLTTSATPPHYPYSMSPDGQSLVFQETYPKTGVDLSLLTFDPKPHTEPLIQTAFTETNAEISPDGHWLAYQSNESGQEEIYVRPFPKVNDGRWQISTSGGTRPLWARNGRELFYLDAGGLLTTVAVQTTPTFSAAMPMRLLNTGYFGGFGGGGQAVAGRTYDVSPDGQRFLMIKDVDAGDPNATPASIVLVLNWTEELKRLVPTR